MKKQNSFIKSIIFAALLFFFEISIIKNSLSENNDKIDPVEFTQQLVRYNSISDTNNSSQILDLINQKLLKLGFETRFYNFELPNKKPIRNLYAKIGNDQGPSFCFAGHYDVVDVINQNWIYDPFAATIIDNKLYGRGVADMKSEIASFISASEQFLLSSPNFKGSIIIILTGDEEINSKRGAKPLTKILKENNQKIDLCIIGEPTSYKILGDIAKTGRRGSINFEISSKEKFDQDFNNEAKDLMLSLYKLVSKKIDAGNKNFQPSNLEVTSINSDTRSNNVIPESAQLEFKILNDNRKIKDTLIVNKVNDLAKKLSIKNIKIDYKNDDLAIKFKATIIGKSGHVAYKENFQNPNTDLLLLVNLLQKSYKNNFILESINNQSIITAKINIRFNNLQTEDSLVKMIGQKIDNNKYKINYDLSGEPFLTKTNLINNLISKAVLKVTKVKTKFTTDGGTSDGRFFKDITDNIAELGLINSTIHSANEYSDVNDIKNLTKIYQIMIEDYFNQEPIKD